VLLNPAHTTRIGGDRDIGMKRDPSTEQDSRKTTPYYVPSSSAIVQVVAGNIRPGLDEWCDGPCITKIEGIDEKQKGHFENDGFGGQEKSESLD